MLRSIKLLSLSNALLLRLLLLLWSPPPATTVYNGDQTVWRQYSRWAPRATAWLPPIPAGRMAAAMVELFGLEMDAQYWDCTASMASFVCAQSFCACKQVRCMHENFKEAITLIRNACSGIIVHQICDFFRFMVSCDEIQFFDDGRKRRENGGVECWDSFLRTSKKN